MQRLPRSARWDADQVRDEVRSYVLGHLGGDGVLIVDGTGFLKKGIGPAGPASAGRAAGQLRGLLGLALRGRSCRPES